MVQGMFYRSRMIDGVFGAEGVIDVVGEMIDVAKE
jgi:hypothetical protein